MTFPTRGESLPSRTHVTPLDERPSWAYVVGDKVRSRGDDMGDKGPGSKSKGKKQKGSKKKP